MNGRYKIASRQNLVLIQAWVKAHDAAISKLSWAHPEFGTILASASFDRSVKIWEQTAFTMAIDIQTTTPPSQLKSSSLSKWSEKAVLVDARGTVRAVEFAPRHFGLKLVGVGSISDMQSHQTDIRGNSFN